MLSTVVRNNNNDTKIMIKYIWTLTTLTILATSCCNHQKAETLDTPDAQDANKGWTEEAKSLMLEGCLGNKPIKGMTAQETKDYCDCMLAKTIEEYPDPDKIEGDLPSDFVRNSGIECLKQTGLWDRYKKLSIEIDKELFISCLTNLIKAFELEPYVETEKQEEKYLRLIKNGIDIGIQISDNFLLSTHPEMKEMFQNKLIKGATLIYEGHLEKEDVSVSLDKMETGADLVNQWSKWWNEKKIKI